MRTVSMLLLLAACSDPGASTVAAQVEEVEAPAPTPEPAAEEAVEAGLVVDNAQSSITFVGAKAVGEHPIVVNDYEGRVVLDGDEVSGVSFVARMDSVEADHPKLTTHLKNEDFFDVPNHPDSRFKSLEIKPGSEREGFTHTVTGELTIKGISKKITFPARIEVGDDTVVASTDFAVDRNLWEITYPGMKDNLIQDTVRMEISFTAPRS